MHSSRSPHHVKPAAMHSSRSPHHVKSAAMHSSRSPHHDPRWEGSSFVNKESPMRRSYRPRIDAVNPVPRPFVRPETKSIMNLYLRGPLQRVQPSTDWQHQSPSNDWSVMRPPIPSPIGPFNYWEDGPPPQSFYSAHPPNVRFPWPPPYHSGPVRNLRIPPRPVLPWHRRADSIGRIHQRRPSAIHVAPNAPFKGSTSTNNALMTQPRLEVDTTKRRHESDDVEAEACEMVVADGLSLHDNVSDEIPGGNKSPCSAAAVTESSPNRIDQLVSAKVEERVQGPTSPKKPRLKVKRENDLVDPSLIKTEDQFTLESKEKTIRTICQSNNGADIVRRNTSSHSKPDCSMDAVSRDHVLYRFLVSEVAMKGLSRCMDDGQPVNTVDEAQLVQEVLILLLFLKSHGNVALLCALGVVDVLAAQNVKGHFVVTHQASHKTVTVSSSEHSYLKNFIRNVRPTLTKDSYGILFKNGESSFSDISLQQAMKYCWAKAQVGLDSNVLWGCLGQLPDDSDLGIFVDQGTRTFTATSASENQVPLVEQAGVVQPPNSETGDFSPSAAVLEDLASVEGSLESEAEEEASPATAILEQQQPVVEESPKCVAVDTSPAAAISKELSVSIKRPKNVDADTSPAAVISKELSVSRKHPKSVAVDTSPVAAIPKEQSVSRKRPKSVDVDTSPAAAIPKEQSVSRKRPKSVDVDTSPAAAIPKEQSVSRKRPKSVNVDTSPVAAIPKEQSVSRKRPKSVDVDTSSAAAIPKEQSVSRKRPKSVNVDTSPAAAIPKDQSVDVDSSPGAAIPLKQSVPRKRPKSVAVEASSAPAGQGPLDTNAVCSEKLEVGQTEKKQEAKTEQKSIRTKPMRPGKKGLQIQCTRWPVSVLHDLCPGLEYSVLETRSPGLYYPMFEVSAVVGGQRFTNTAPSIKRAKFFLAQTTLKCVYDIDNVHEGLPTEPERKEAKIKKDQQAKKKNPKPIKRTCYCRDSGRGFELCFGCWRNFS